MNLKLDIMRNITLLFILLLHINLSNGQEFSTMDNFGIMPGTNEASASIGISEIPVNLSTGIPTINIPILTINGHSISAPVSIAYNAIGRTVNERATFVGLGWSLQAGGQIMRVVKGWPDECDFNSPNDGVGSGQDHSQLIGEPNGGYLDQTVPSSYDDMNPNDRELAIRAAAGRLDLQPDEFYFNFLGQSGMFVLDAQGFPFLVPFQNLTITYEPDLSSFTIRDAKGYTYLFDIIETTRSDSNCEGPGPQLPESSNYSSWLLREVRNAAGEIELQFEYHLPIAIQYTDSYETRVDYWGDNCPAADVSNCTITHFQKVRHLKKIVGNGYYAEFTLGSERADITHDRVLSNIKLHLEDGALLNQFNLMHSYFGEGDQNSSLRLRLDGITELNSQLEATNPTLFEYDPRNLPPYGSKAQDHWGFFNGRTSNASLIPQNIDCFGSRDPYLLSGIRASNLTQITYPSGASTRMNFEPNVYGANNGGLVGAGGCSQYLNNSVGIMIHTSQESGHLIKNEYFTLAQSQNVQLDFSLNLEECGKVSGFEIRNLETGLIVYSNYAEVNQYISTVVQLALTPGNYELTCHAIGNADHPCAHTLVTITFNPANIFAKNRYGGGLRLKSLVYSDGDNDLSNDKVIYYDYQKTDEPDRSSGYLLTSPRYGYATGTGYIVYDADTPWPNHNCSDYNTSNYDYHHECATNHSYSFSTDALQKSQGGYVFYRNIKEKVLISPTSGFNGSTSYSFRFEPNATNHPVIQEPVANPNWRRGMPELVQIRDANGVLLKEMESDYGVIHSRPFQVEGMKSAIEVMKKYTGSGDNDEYCFWQFEPGAIVYSYSSELFAITQTTTKEYSSSGSGDFIETLVQYEYSQNSPFQLNKIITHRADPLYPF